MTATTIIVSIIVPMLTPCEDVNSQGDSVLEGIFFGFDMIAFLSASITVTLRASFIHYRERSMMKFLSIMDKVMMVSELLAIGAWVTRTYISLKKRVLKVELLVAAVIYLLVS
ncbi:hypothetical protein L1887_18998 [Cichorium endivia]|nr:hypothetical protein L1887_18998 [Cichorium endivia]